MKVTVKFYESGHEGVAFETEMQVGTNPGQTNPGDAYREAHKRFMQYLCERTRYVAVIESEAGPLLDVEWAPKESEAVPVAE